MTIVQVKNINKIYGENKISITALKNINLKIEKGEFTALVGPSGSGKTTLLNLIGGLDKPTSGEIIIDEKNISNLNKNELTELRLRNIGFVFQFYNLILVLTAFDNVEYVMLLQGISREERKEKAFQILKEVGLSGFENRRPNEMSGGQQQRVAVARAIVSEPKIILADEPTANLDSKTGASLLDLMKELNEKKKATFIFSTHDKMVMQRAKRLIHLKDGEIDESV
jgi:putative ABC transport system ATP-binding protein